MSRYVTQERGAIALLADIQDPAGRSPVADRILARRPAEPVSLYPCAGCPLRRPAEAFHRDASRLSGLAPYCRECVSLKTTAWYRTLVPSKKQAKLALLKARRVDLTMKREYDRTWKRAETVAEAVAQQKIALLAAGKTMKGRRSWTWRKRDAERAAS